MLSEQIGRNVTNGHYEDLQKVYSIWIVMNCPKKWANTISQCGMTMDTPYGQYDEDPRIDLMKVLMIRLPKDGDTGNVANPASKLHEMLSTVLSESVPAKEKLERMEKDFDITVTREIEEEVDDMCNYSSMIENNASVRNSMEIAVKMINAGKLADDEIAEYTDLTMEQIKELREESKKS